MSEYDEILSYMPRDGLFEVVDLALENNPNRGIDEIRLRCLKPLSFVINGKVYFVTKDGEISHHCKNAYIVKRSSIETLFSLICENSIYAYLDEIRQGFITIAGGHRIGFVGRVIVNENGDIENFRDISSLNIRVAREILGSADEIIEYIKTPSGVKSTLVIAPPGVGKTTILRDIARQLSNSGIKVGIADDRSEISAMHAGIASNDIGMNTDVIENGPKALSITILLRTMSPNVIITDELIDEHDIRAVCYAKGSGCSIIASVHGSSFDEIEKKPVFIPLFKNRVFENYILLNRSSSTSSVMEVEVRHLK